MNFQPEGAPYEYEAYVSGTSVRAQMNKIGGGTPPKQYAGAWEYVLRADTANGKVLMEGTDLNIPLLATKVAFEFLPEDEPQAPAVHIHVGHNIPGYLTESDIMCFDSVEDALDALKWDVREQRDFYFEGCEATSSEQREKGSDCCEWCSTALDCEADLSAIADGDAAYAFNRDKGLSYGYEPPEGPNIRHWATLVADSRDDCEIFAEQES